ncbi:MAG: hypothetical protein JWR51_4713 [Devosia sp.]|uniref:hypothetical protein n=1 Tax=Devosia sp. TaxID=1871048 RepID=UPI002625D2E0|nr:hypothetical protein [Devosia sp.]MDB5531610.1 hypothetical protein [Devosia sp.]
MTEEREYPRWVHCPGTIPGKKSALVNSSEAEAAQLAAWGVADEPAPLVVNPLIPAPPASEPFDHDGNGKPGGSLKPAGADLPALRLAYKAKFGKRAFPGWDAAEITKRMAAD